MSERPDRDLAQTVRALVAARVPGLDVASMGDETPIGPEGLGLDSISFVEVLLECEASCGVVLPRELLAGAPLTIGGLVGAVRDARELGRDA